MTGALGPTPGVNAATQAVHALLDLSGVDDDELIAATSAHGVDATAIGRQGLGWTMLHAAALQGRDEWARLLLRLGAEVDAKNAMQETPLQVACCSHRLGMAALLLRAGANLHTVDCNGDDLWAAVRREMGLRGAKQAGELLALLDKYAGTGDSGAEAERVRKQGNEAFARRDYDGALKHYAAANAIEPHAHACANAALIHVRREKWREALAEANKAIKLDASYGKGWYHKIQVFLCVRDFGRACSVALEAAARVSFEDPTLPRLNRIVHVMNTCSVDMYEGGSQKIDELRRSAQRVGRGAPSQRCTYCRRLLEKPLSRWPGCPYCSCCPTDARGAEVVGKLAEIDGELAKMCSTRASL